MKRSFSIGLTAALIVISYLPQAHAGYDREAWIQISNVGTINASWTTANFATVKAEIKWDEDSSSTIYGGSNDTKDEESSITSVSLSHFGTYAEASSTAQIPGLGSSDWAKVIAGASEGTGAPGPYSWGKSTVTLERQFTAIADGQVQLEFRFDYGIKTDDPMAAGLLYDAKINSTLVPKTVTIASGFTVLLTGDYIKDQTDIVRLSIDARAYDQTSQCGSPPIPAPVAVVLASVGVVTVVVLRRRRVI